MKKIFNFSTIVILASFLTVSIFAKTSKSQVQERPQFIVNPSSKVTAYTTAQGTDLKLSLVGQLEFKEKKQPLESEIFVFVDPDKSFQTILGFGGALTDAAAETFAALPEAQQRKVLRDYFDPREGIGYTLARTHIHSCDFSSESYTYVQEGDSELKTFDISRDKKFKIPFIKAAMKAAGGKLTLYASPWSPPAFMKDNNDILHGGHLKPEFYSTWAAYYAKFIHAYEAEGIPIWGISIQNEAMATQRWESCIYTAEAETQFLKNHLGPTLKKTGLGNIKIIAWDHNRDLIYHRASEILNDKEAAKYLWGIGFHWYENWSGGLNMFDNLKLVAQTFPNTNLLFTEGSVEKYDAGKTGEWRLGETYGLNMINDFNSGSVGFTDWNILLNEKGGPNHVANYCFAPIHGNTKTGELVYTNSYYYIGHFSKFVKPGAVRILASASRSQLLSTAFRNTDGSIAVIVMNPTEKPAKYNLWLKGWASENTALPHSISTLVL